MPMDNKKQLFTLSIAVPQFSCELLKIAKHDEDCILAA
jgi:hypothetical protein